MTSVNGQTHIERQQWASWEEFSDIVAALDYLVLATADQDGMPWASPVFFRMAANGDLVWVSAPKSRHSSNIAARSTVAATIFNSTVPIGGAKAAYLIGHASLVHHDAIVEALRTLNRDVPAAKQLSPDDVSGAGPLRIYHLRVMDRWILLPGGDPRNGDQLDARLPVESPPAGRSLLPQEGGVKRGP